MATKIKAIIFDLDGTLIDSMNYHFLAFKEMLLEKKIRVPDALLRKLVGKSTEEILKALKKKYHFKQRPEDLRQERRYHYFMLVGKKNIVFPHAIETLKKLRLNYKLAIATGSSQIVLNHSAPKELQELFDTIITINDVQKGKPAPDIFLLAAKKLKAKPEQCLAIGDSIYDAIAAKKAKMRFIGATTGFTSKKELQKYSPIKIIPMISKLEEAMKELSETI